MAAKQPTPRTLSPEIPVISYPTPNITDLLVVQDVDTRLPGYTPANYGDFHPDQVAYPGLKLVYQTPLDNEANFMWVRRVYANERFNQEAYNYAIKYSGEDPTKPIYVRTYTLPRAEYEPVAKGTADPVYSSAVLVEEAVERIKDDQTDSQLDSLFLKVTRVYETLPGPGLTTRKKGNANSIPAKFQAARQVTVTKTTVAAATQPDDTTSTIIESSVEQASVAKAQKVNSVLDTDIVTLTGKKVTPQQQVATVTETMVPTGSGQDVVVADALTLEGTVDNLGNGQSVITKTRAPSVFPETQLAKEKPALGIPMKFKVANPPTKTGSVVEGTVSESDVSLGTWDMDATAEQVTEFKKKLSKSSMASGDMTLTGTQTGMWGVEEVAESLVSNVPAAQGAYKKREEAVDPVGDGRSVKKTVSYPDSPATLVEYRTDETYKIRVRIEKSLVDISSLPPSTGYVERQAIDAWNAVQIVSIVDPTSLPGPETWEHTLNYSFPDELETVGVIYSKKDGGNSSTGGVNNASLEDTDSWRAEANAHANAAISAVPFVKIKAGYSGPCKASTTRTYHASPPTSNETVTVIRAVSGAVIVTGYGGSAQASGQLSGSGTRWLFSGGGNGSSTELVSLRYAFGPVLHDGPSLTETGDKSVTRTSTASAGSVPAGNYPAATATASAQLTSSLQLPASTHGRFSTGDSLIASVRVEKWRFGIWIKEVTTIYHP